MSEAVSSPAAAPTTAGGLLRQARQAQGLHIAALAAAIKVVPRKLELLESDRFDQLPDATFTRALAQTVCRTLKIDAAPVLALLPPVQHAHRLEQVAEGLNTPFRERPGRLAPKEWASVTSPVLWIAALIVALTIAVYALPAHWFSLANLKAAANTEGPSVSVSTVVAPVAASAASAPAADGNVAVAEAPAAAPAPEASAALAAEPAASTPAAPDAAAAPAGMLQLTASAPSWVGVTDARGQSLIARLLQPGESVGLDGTPPFKVRIGNVAATRVVFRGEPLELRSTTRDNVARLELK